MRAPAKRGEAGPVVGLALGAGGARGLAHVGVLRTLIRADVRIDAVVGTSIGAVVGAVYAAGQLEAFERQIQSAKWRQVLRMFDPVWPRSGLLSGDRAVDWLSRLVGDWRIEDLPIPFGAVCVDLVSGDEILIREGRVLDAVRASMSIPGVFVPHRSGARVLVDGALRNPVPVSHLDELGADIRLAVNLHSQPVREIADPETRERNGLRQSIASRITGALDARLSRFRFWREGSVPEDDPQSAPNLFDIMTASMTIMEFELARHRLAVEPVDVSLTPDVHAIRSLEFHKARQAIGAGVVEAEARLGEIREAIERRRRRRYWSRGSSRASPS